MTKWRHVLIDDFEDHAAGEIVANQSGSTWAAEAGDDDLASVVADTRLGGSKCLRIHDDSRTTQASVTKTIPVAGIVGDVLPFGVYPITGTYSSDEVHVKIREGATIIIWLKLRLTTGLWYYSTDNGANFTTTTISATLDAKNTMEVELTSTTTFKIRKAGGTWSAALNNDNTITTSVTKIELTSTEANDDGGVVTQNIDETFESFTVPNSIIGGQWSWIVGPAGTDSMTCQTGKVGRFTYGGSGRTQVAFDFDSASADSPAAGWWASAKTTVVNTGTSKGCVFMVKAASGPVTWVEFHHDGKIYALNNAALTDTGYTWAAGTQYVLKHEGASATTYNVYLDGTKIANAYTNYGGMTTNGTTLTKYAMDTNFFGSTNADGQTELDDITVSWNSSTAYTAGTIDCYFDDFWLYQHSHSNTCQIRAYEYLGSSTKKLVSGKGLIHEQADGSVLCLVEDTADSTADVYRISGTALDTWTKYIDTGVATASVACKSATTTAGTVYTVNKISGGVIYMAKSTDYGATASYNKSTGFANIYDLFTISGTLYAVTATNAGGNDTVRIQKLNSEAGDPITWTERATIGAMGDSAIGGGTYGPQVIHGFVSGGTYWFVYVNDGGYDLLSYTDAGPTFTNEDTLTATAGGNIYAGMVWDTSVTWTHTTSGKAWISVKAGADYYTYYTTNGGDTWSAWSNSGATSSCDALQAGTTSQKYMALTTNAIYEINTSTHKGERILCPDFSDYDTALGLGHTVLLASNGTTTLVYKLQLMDAKDAGVVHAELTRNIVLAASRANKLDIQTTADNPYNFEQGQQIMLYDPWDTLIFKGRLRNTDTNRNVCAFIGWDSTREIRNPYGTGFTTQKVSYMLETVIAAMQTAYVVSIQDVNTAGTMTYDISDYHEVTPLIRLARAMERAVIWTTPAGGWSLDHYDDCDALGYRVHEGAGHQWKLIGNSVRVADARITRASVHYKGTPHARYTYIGNTSLEGLEGISTVHEFHDAVVEAAADATDLATQLYNEFAGSTTFARFLVVDHGLIQEGKTVDASYTLGQTTLARANYIVLAVKYYLLSGVAEVTIGSNIMLPDEYANLNFEEEGTTD